MSNLANSSNQWRPDAEPSHNLKSQLQQLASLQEAAERLRKEVDCLFQKAK